MTADRPVRSLGQLALALVLVFVLGIAGGMRTAHAAGTDVTDPGLENVDPDTQTGTSAAPSGVDLPSAPGAPQQAEGDSLQSAPTSLNQTPVFSESFDTDLGNMVANNDGSGGEWHFNNTCPPTGLSGHSSPGTARWGTIGNCNDYGSIGSSDDLDTPSVPISSCAANLELSFNYFLDTQEPGSFDRARVEVSFDGGAFQQLAESPDPNLMDPSSGWQSTTFDLTSNLPANTMVARFTGETDDGIGNSDDGFYIDDVVVACLIEGPPVFLAEDFTLTITDPVGCTGSGDRLQVAATFTNIGNSTAEGVVYEAVLPPELAGVAGTCDVNGGGNITCNVGENSVTATGTVPGIGFAPDNAVVLTYEVRVRGGLPVGTRGTIEQTFSYDTNEDGINDQTLTEDATVTINCEPSADPNRQLGRQVHLPVLNFQGQDEACDTWIEVQNLGPEEAKAVLVTWAAPGFCPPQCAGPLKVECSGLLQPGSTWNFLGAQVPSGSKSGILFKFSARQLSEIGVDLGDDDIVADAMCEILFFGVVGDCDDYRRFKKAYNERLDFGGIPQGLAAGFGALAVDVLRTCPADTTLGVDVTSKYNGIAGDHLGVFDPIFGGFSYYVPLVYADRAGFNSIMYIQNGGLECSSVEIWFKQQDDCLRARICEVFALAPGETYQFDATDCVGPDWQGSAWVRTSQPTGIVVDIIGRDVLMTYVGEPSELNYTYDPEDAFFTQGNQVAYGPLIYSEFQGWDSGVQVQNLSSTFAAKVKVYFLDRSGDIVTTLVDWVCPRGSQTFFLPVIHNMPGNWVGSVRVESQEWWTPGDPVVPAANIVGIATLIKYNDAARTETTEAIAYNLLPEHKAFDWQIGFGGGGSESGVGLIAIPSLLKDLDATGVTSEVAVANLVPKPGFTDYAMYIYDQNGLLDYVCEKLNEKQVEYIDLQTWGYINPGFKGSAIISATFWEHDVFDGDGFFVRNLLGLAAVAVERSGTRLGEDIPGDEAAGARGIPFRQDINPQDEEEEPFRFRFLGPTTPVCPGQPRGQRPDPFNCGARDVTIDCIDCPINITDNTTITSQLPVTESDIPPQCQITDLDVRLSIDHTWISDLSVTLSSPQGSQALLFSTICGSADDIRVTLDDEAPQVVGSVCTPLNFERFDTLPQDTLTQFEGQSPYGDWILNVTDAVMLEEGQLLSWSLVFALAEQ